MSAPSASRVDTLATNISADISELTDHDQHLSLNRSEATYLSMAPVVGLDPHQKMRDADEFTVVRARIPSSLFREIVSDIHISLNQYGPSADHETEEARSRLLAPLMNRLIAQFSLQIQNSPERVIVAGDPSKAYIVNRYKVYGVITLFLIEDRFRTDSATDRLNAIAQVIAEAQTCHAMNSCAGVNTLILGILSDSRSFKFFRFDGDTPKPTFAKGLYTEDRNRTFDIPSFEFPNADIFEVLRRLCEVLYGQFLAAFTTGLKVKMKALIAQMKGYGKDMDAALKLALQAKLGATLAMKQVTDQAMEDMAVEAFGGLKKSIKRLPDQYQRKSDLMGYWSEDDIYLSE